MGHYQYRLLKAQDTTRKLFDEIKRDVAEIEATIDRGYDNDREKMIEIIGEARYKIHILAEKLY